jgi:hypothetical protein
VTAAQTVGSGHRLDDALRRVTRVV